VQGFRIQVPYLVKDLADTMYDLDGGPSPEDNTLPASINMDFNGAQDRKILASTPRFCYWWEKHVVPEGEGDASGSSAEDFPRVTHEVTEAHFKAFWHGVSILLLSISLSISHNISYQSTTIMREGIKARGRRNVDMNPPVPGLAPKPPPPLPSTCTSNLAPNASGSSINTCPNCTSLREALRQAHEQLLSAQTCINGAIILGKEAIERSSVRVGAYGILDQVRRQYGIPFEGGRPLPEEYTKHFPLHKYDDGTLRTPHADAEVATEGGSHSHRDYCAGNSTPSNESTEESDESIPPGFSPSEQSHDEGSERPWGGESEDDGDWELDPQALSGSDIESSYGEHHEHRPGLKESEEYNQSDDESDEDGSGEGEDDQSGE